MEDYPRTLGELEERPGSEEACREYLCAPRWPEGFRCPRCNHGKAWPVGKRFECRKCGYPASVTASTKPRRKGGWGGPEPKRIFCPACIGSYRAVLRHRSPAQDSQSRVPGICLIHLSNND